MNKAVGLVSGLTISFASSLYPALAAPITGGGKFHFPRGATSCHFSAWLSFRAHGPIPMRAGPHANARIVGALPTPPIGDDEASAIEFDVLEAQPGWLKIDHIVDPDRVEAKEAAASPALPRGAGWIPFDVVQVGIQSARGYAHPDAASLLILNLGDDWLTDMGKIDAMRGCAGDWLLVEYHIEHRRGPSDALISIPEGQQPKGAAWFRGICSNQQTTCDMPSVDRHP